MTRKTLGRIFLAAALTGGAAAGFMKMNAPEKKPAPGLPATFTGHTYWQPAPYPIILDIWRCPQSGLCGRIQWLDPDNADIRYAASLLLDKKLSQTTREDVLGLCGYEARVLEMKPNGFNPYVKLGPWKGRVETPPATVNIELEDRADGTLYAYGFVGFRAFGAGMTFQGVQNPPACAPSVS